MMKMLRFAALPLLSVALAGVAPAMAQGQQNTAPATVTGVSLTPVPNPTTQILTTAPTRALKYQYIWRRGSRYTSRASVPDTATALNHIAAAQTGDCIVVERAGRRYLITDKYILDHANEAYASLQAQRQEAERALQTQTTANTGSVSSAGNRIGNTATTERQSLNSPQNSPQLETSASGNIAPSHVIAPATHVLVSPIIGTAAPNAASNNQTKTRDARQRGQKIDPAQRFEDKMTRLLDTAFLRQMTTEVTPEAKADAK